MSTDKLSAEQEAIRRYPPKYPRSTSDPAPDDDSVYDLNEEARMRFISGADWYRDTVAKELEKLQAFKQYVHDRLDKMGIPSDPEPENNAAHGCRIEGRLNVVEKMMGNNVA